jgi:hypothetical protein
MSSPFDLAARVEAGSVFAADQRFSTPEYNRWVGMNKATRPAWPAFRDALLEKKRQPATRGA